MISINMVWDHQSLRKIFSTKICHMKVSWQEYFYGNICPYWCVELYRWGDINSAINIIVMKGTALQE